MVLRGELFHEIHGSFSIFDTFQIASFSHTIVPRRNTLTIPLRVMIGRLGSKRQGKRQQGFENRETEPQNMGTPDAIEH